MLLPQLSDVKRRTVWQSQQHRTPPDFHKYTKLVIEYHWAGDGFRYCDRRSTPACETSLSVGRQAARQQQKGPTSEIRNELTRCLHGLCLPLREPRAAWTSRLSHGVGVSHGDSLGRRCKGEIGQTKSSTRRLQLDLHRPIRLSADCSPSQRIP